MSDDQQIPLTNNINGPDIDVARQREIRAQLNLAPEQQLILSPPEAVQQYELSPRSYKQTSANILFPALRGVAGFNARCTLG